MPATPTMPATKFRPHLTISDHIGAYSAPICRGHGPLLRRKGPRPTKAISSSANPWPVVYTLPAVAEAGPMVGATLCAPLGGPPMMPRDGASATLVLR